MPTLNASPIETADTRYEPWTDGHALGFKVTRLADSATGYIYLNPSVNEYGGPDDTPAVFVYMGGYGNPVSDSPVHFYEIDQTAYDLNSQ